MKDKKKKILIISIIFGIICLGFLVSYGFFVFDKSTDTGIVIETGEMRIVLNSGDSINLTNSFPMSYEEANNNSNNVLLFNITHYEDVLTNLYYGFKLVPTDENTIPLEYISFDIFSVNNKLTESLDYYGDNCQYTYYLRNSKLSEFENKFIYSSSFGTSEGSISYFGIRVWINDDCKIGNMAGNVSPTEWENYITSVKLVVESSEEPNGFEPQFAYLAKRILLPGGAGSVKYLDRFLNNSTKINQSLLTTSDYTLNSVVDTQNFSTCYFFPNITSFKEKAIYTKVINFDKVSVAEFEALQEGKTANVDYFNHEDYVNYSVDIIGYFKELYTEDSITYYSYNIVSYKTILFPSDSANMFEFIASSSNTNNTTYDWNSINDDTTVVSYLANIEEINFNNVDTRNVVDFGYMFQNLTKLKKIDLSNFNTSIAKRMSGMFLWCESLEEIDLTNLDTSRVTRMDWMFAGTDIVETETEKNFIGLEDLDVSNVKYLDNIFSNCLNVEYLDLSNWKTGELAGFIINNKNDSLFEYKDHDNYIYGYYNYCHLIVPIPADGDFCYTVGGIMGGNTNLTGEVDNNLKYLDISNFDMSNITNLNSFFSGYTELEILKIDNWDTSSVTNWDYFMFECKNIKEFDISKLDTSSATTMICTFKGLAYNNSTYELDFSDLDTSKVKSFIGTFAGLNSTSINVDYLDTSSATTMRGMFRDCKKLVSLDLTSFDFSKCTCLTSFVYGNENLENINYASSVDVSKVTSFMDMFSYCRSLETIDLSKFNNSVVTNLSYMFYECNNAKTIILSGFNTSNVTSMQRMFTTCTNLEHIYVSNNFVTTAVTDNGSLMFKECDSLYNISASEDRSYARAIIKDETNTLGVLELYSA